MADHNDFGKLAEELAADFLTKKGYKILVKNYRFRKAEVDIIAEFESQIIIVEVKARQNHTVMEPHEAVNKAKIRLLVAAADEFMKERTNEVRFDIIAVIRTPNGKLEITYIENAFDSIDAN